MNKAAILTFVLLTQGCAPFVVIQDDRTPYIIAPWRESFLSNISFEPVRAVEMPSGRQIDVLKLGDREVLEVKCQRIPVEVATSGYTTTGTRIDRQPTKHVVETIVEAATNTACAAESFRACRWITRNGRSTFIREASLEWYGTRHVGPAFYVRCMTPTEFGTWISSSPGNKARVRSDAESAFLEYLRWSEIQ